MKDIKTIASKLIKEHNLNVIMLWDNSDVERHFKGPPQCELMKSTPFFATSKVMDNIPVYVKIDLNTLPEQVNAPQGTNHLNVLCHELGHVIADLKAPQYISDLDLNYVINFEKQANIIGKRLYSRYKDASTYWNNHEDIERMKGHLEKYTGILA